MSALRQAHFVPSALSARQGGEQSRTTGLLDEKDCQPSLSARLQDKPFGLCPQDKPFGMVDLQTITLFLLPVGVLHQREMNGG